MKGLGYVMKKELSRVFKDKKMAFSMFILPVILIVGMFALIGNLMDRVNQDIKEHQSVVYIQNAPQDFSAYLSKIGDTGKIEYLEQGADTADIKEGIRQGSVDLLLEFPTDFTSAIANYHTGAVVPQVKTYYNPSEDYSAAARGKYATEVLEGYRQQLLAERIGDLSSIIVFSIDSDNPEMVIQDDEKASGKMLGMMLPYFITLMLFAGVMGIGIDTITGEKERGTIATLLLTPLNRSLIVLGKIIALMILAGLSATIYVVSMVITMPRIMVGSFRADSINGLAINFSALQIVQIAAIMISLVFLYVAIVSLVAVFAKTIKEGSTYVMPVYIIVMAVGMITMYGGAKEPQLAHYLIPLYNSSMAMKELFTYELSLVEFLVTLVSTLAAGGILTGIIVKAFNNEKVMFNA